MSSHHKPTSSTVSMAMLGETGPTSTTKALLVTVVAPRKFFTPKTPYEEWATSTTCIPDSRPKDNEQKTKGVVTEMATEKDTASSEESIHGDETEERVSTNDNNDTEEHSVTAEEAAAVAIVGDDPDEQEVNVEELLRIAMQTLLEEWHLLNVPTYSNVLDKQAISHKISLHNLFSNHSLRIREVTSFIRMDVMARTASLGIILERLERIGIGVQVGTVAIYKAELCKTASPYAHLPVSEENSFDLEEEDDDANEENNHKDTSNHNEDTEHSKKSQQEKERLEQEMQERMIQEAKLEWKNAATRLRIEQVREQIVEQAAFSFDFIALLTVASILAGIGLITNNTVVIVASMLVSPIMGPVLGLTFGSRIQDWPLVKISLRNELYALLGCVFIGVVTGVAAGWTSLATETWPTNEMQSRGEWTGLLTGIAVAIPSGMGVCLSILGGNTSSLVGVAISASLLPPAVNAGICLLYSILLATNAVISDSGLNAADFAQIGGVSFALTAINIICIWVSGIVMFEIKEVAPTKQKTAFWAKDLREARELNKGHKRPSPIDLGVLRKGLKAALRKKTDKPVETVKIEPPKREPSERASLGTAFAFRPTTHPAGGWSLAVSEDEPEIVENDDNVRFVGLEDMAKLLGFDQEEDDEEEVTIDHAAVARKIGHGRYI